MNNYKCGEIYWVNFKGTGHQIKGWHPAIIIQNNLGNKYSSNVQVIPISSSMTKSKLATHVFLDAEQIGLPKNSIAQCEGQTLITKNDIGEYIGELPKAYLKRIAIAININNPILGCFEQDEFITLLPNFKKFLEISSVK